MGSQFKFNNNILVVKRKKEYNRHIMDPINKLILFFLFLFLLALVAQLIITNYPKTKKQTEKTTDGEDNSHEHKPEQSKDYEIEVLKRLMPQQIDFGFMQGLRFGMGFAVGFFVISLLSSLVLGAFISGVVSQMF